MYRSKKEKILFSERIDSVLDFIIGASAIISMLAIFTFVARLSVEYAGIYAGGPIAIFFFVVAVLAYKYRIHRN